MMHKRALMAILLTAVLLLSGCSLVEKDPEVDKSTLILQVGDKAYTKAEVQSYVDYQIMMESWYAQMYGYTIDPTSAAVQDYILDQVLSSLKTQSVAEQMAREKGMYDFTDEEKAEIESDAQTAYDSDVESVKTSYFTETELTGDELDAAIAAKMEELGYSTKEAMIESGENEKALEKLRADIVKDVEVTHDDIHAKYDELLQADMQSFASNPSAYGDKVNAQTDVYYTPAGYRYVRHILRKFSNEETTQINDLQSQVTSKQSQLSTVANSLSELEGDIAEMGEDATDEMKQEAETQKATLLESQATYNAELSDLQTQLDAAKTAAYERLQPSVDEVLAKLGEENADFAALMAEYGEDPGMQSEPLMTTGYAICEGFASFDPAFTEAAMALENIGDISAPVRGQSGIHIIRYEADIPEGALDHDAAEEKLHDTVLSEKQTEAYDAQLATWVSEAKIQEYKDRMKD